VVPITLDELAACADDVDAAAAATLGVDTFCSSAAWVLGAAGTLTEQPTPWLWRGDDGFVLCQRAIHPDGFPFVAPMELMWGLQAPTVGRDPQALGAAVAEVLATTEDWAVALWPGLAGDSPLLPALRRALPRAWSMRLGPTTVRHVAQVGDGRDAFLRRRSRNFVRSARRADERATAAGVTFELVRDTSSATADESFARLIAIERRSWKAGEGVGLQGGAFQEFYRRLVGYVAPRGRLRLVFARHQDQDVAYCLGAVFAGAYRGLQFSYDDAHAAWSLGTLCQLHQIEALAHEATPVHAYDLGTDMDYKRRWADGVFETRMLVIQRG
jgi:hypothetical protein